MFRENNKHKENLLFDFYSTFLSNDQRGKLDEGWGKRYYEEIFKNIDESIFTKIYSEKYSRPNFPINILVSLLILKMKFNYSDEELFEQYNYNIMFRYALGLRDFGEYPLVPRTYYNFKKRLIEYEETTGIKLIEELFQRLNDIIKIKYNIKSKEQRVDSTLIWSNIKKMSRLELCIETFKKFYSSLKIKPDNEVEKYVLSESDNYCFKLRKEEVVKELESIGFILYKYYKRYLKDEIICHTPEFKLIERLLYEQFEVNEDKEMVTPKENKEIKSSFLQSPHDPEATYRQKGNIKSEGYVVTVTETAKENNLFNIITDIDVSQNIESDGKILEKKIENFKENGVEKIYADGGYDEDGLFNTAEENNVEIVLTGLKGKERESGKIKIEDFDIEKDRINKCPLGYTPTNIENFFNKIKISFDSSMCEKCANREQCLVKKKKNCYQIIVKKSYLKKSYLRKQMTPDIYKKAVGIRAISESSMKQIKWCCYKDKIRFRRQKNIRIIFIARAIAINFGRINGYWNELSTNLAKISENITNFLTNFNNFIKNSFLYDFFLKKLRFSF